MKSHYYLVPLIITAIIAASLLPTLTIASEARSNSLGEEKGMVMNMTRTVSYEGEKYIIKVIMSKYRITKQLIPTSEFGRAPSTTTLSGSSASFIVISDRNAVKVGRNFTLKIVALDSHGFLANIRLSVNVSTPDGFILLNTTTNEYGVATLSIRADSYGYYKVVNVTSPDIGAGYVIYKDMERVKVKASDVIILRIFSNIDEGSSYLHVLADGNATLTFTALDFNGTPYNGSLELRLDGCEPSLTTLNFTNGIATVTIIPPTSNEAEYWCTGEILNGNTTIKYVTLDILKRYVFITPLNDYIKFYGVKSMSVPVIVFGRDGRAVSNGTLLTTISYETIDNTWGYYSYNATIKDGVALIDVDLTNKSSLYIHLDGVAIDNKYYVNLGDWCVCIRRYTPPPPVTTTTTTTTTPVPQYLRIYAWLRLTEGNVYLVATVSQDGNPVSGATVYFYLPWTSEVLSAKTDDYGEAYVNVTNILLNVINTPELYYGFYSQDAAYAVAVVSNGTQTSYDEIYIDIPYITSWLLGWPLHVSTDNDNVIVELSNSYANLTLPIYSTQDVPLIMEHNYSKYLGLLSGGESITIPINEVVPHQFYGRVIIWTSLSKWSERGILLNMSVPAYIALTRVGENTCNYCSNSREYFDVIEYVGNPIIIEGNILSNTYNYVSAKVYGFMSYYMDGAEFKFNSTYGNGNFTLKYSPVSNETYAVGALVAILDNGLVVGSRYYDIIDIYGNIASPTTTTTTTTPITNTTTTITTNTTTTATTLKPVLVGGTLRIYSDNTSEGNLIYIAGALTAALLAGLVIAYIRKRR